jgi:CheY-like chemotaxis protein
MSMKHALVVDDSRSAQIALKKQLEEHDLVVDLAASGEEALEFLEHRSADVIFMDHTMPGMDGLQALAAIKRNPRTAMIPVMMYTTKEGEVYVGQARALGGLGVLPKSVQPHVLFDMLLNLGLVKDKRAAAPVEVDSPLRRATDLTDDGEPRIEPPGGIALAALVGRIIEDQAALRAELRSERDRLARHVAAEVIEAQRTERTPPIEGVPIAPMSPAPSQSQWTLLTTFFAATTVIVALLAWQYERRIDPTAAPSARDSEQRAQIGDLEVALHTAATRAQARYFKGIDALQWAVNQHAGLPFDELPFDDTRAAEIRDLLERLVALGFKGRVRIESHLGEFCLVGDESSGFQLADADAAIDACTLLGHPLDDSSFLPDRQSVGFAEFMERSPVVNGSGIVVELVAHDRGHSLAQVPLPTGASRAGDWNRIAERNNRLEFSLIPSGD